MKIKKFASGLLLLALTSVILTGCAAGAATAAYAVRSNTADSLTAEGEQRIIDRTRREIMAELSSTSPCSASPR